jgi:hypothetical protein
MIKQRRFDTQLFQDEHVKERYAEIVCNGFQMLGGLGFAEYGVSCQVFQAAITHMLGSTPQRSQHTCQLSKDTKWLLHTKHELPKSSHSQPLAQHLKRQVTTTIKHDAKALYLDEGT